MLSDALAHMLRDAIISFGDLQQFATRAQVAQMEVAHILRLAAHLLRAALPIIGIFNKARHIVPPHWPTTPTRRICGAA